MYLYHASLSGLLFFFGCTHGMWKFPGQGAKLSLTCHLCHSCSNAGFLTHLATCSQNSNSTCSIGILSFFFFFLFFRATPAPYGCSQARWQIIQATAAYHSHNPSGSELCLQPTPQLTAVLGPYPTEQGQGSNPHPHEYQSGSLPLSHQRKLHWPIFLILSFCSSLCFAIRIFVSSSNLLCCISFLVCILSCCFFYLDYAFILFCPAF